MIPKTNIRVITPEDWHYDFFSPFAVLRKEKGIELLTSYYCLSTHRDIRKGQEGNTEVAGSPWELPHLSTGFKAKQ